MSETPTKPLHAVVWSEIPVTDMERARAFYADVLQAPLTLQEDGPNPIAVLPPCRRRGRRRAPLPRHAGIEGRRKHGAPRGLREARGDDGAGPQSGWGSDERGDPRSRARHFFYALDPDGNSIGFFAD